MKEKDKKEAFKNGSKVAKKARKKIEKENEKRAKKNLPPLTKKEEQRIKKMEILKRKFRNTLITLGIGVGIGSAGTAALLNPGNEGNIRTESEIDSDKTDVDIGDIIKSKKEIFLGWVQDIGKINTEIDGEIDQTQEKENQKFIDEAKNDIAALKTGKNILDYIKEIYANEISENSGKNISAEQISFNKTREDANIYRDIAVNGEEILRNEYSKEKNKEYLDISRGVITAYIKDGETNSKEQTMYYSNGYKTIYLNNERVVEYEDNTLSEIGEVIDAGIDWYTGMAQGETAPDIKQGYKTEFINAVAKYKEKQATQQEKQETIIEGEER